MQITKCFVKDFGKLSNYTLDLNQNLNTINQQNGWGKSTLATFIKAMLFGLPSTTKRDLNENERLKYKPWNKEMFGGYIEFVLDGTPYRLERQFGSKQSQDSAVLYDLNTNKISTTYTPNIMEEYFNINTETFERTTYIKQGQIETDINDGIRAKLGNLLQNERENNFKSALNYITEQRKQKQLYRGKGGQIDDIRQKIDEQNLRLNNALLQKEQLQNLQYEYNNQQNILQQKQTELLELEKQLEELNKQHTKNIEIERYEELEKKLNDAKSQYQNTLNFFKGEIPTPLTLNNIQTDINLYNQKQVLLANTNNINNTELDNLNQFFNKHLPTKQEIDTQLSRQQDITKLEQQYNSAKQNYAPTLTPQTQSKNNNLFYIILVCVLGIIAGSCICAFKSILFGAIIIACGATGCIVCIVLYSVQKNRLAQNNAHQKIAYQQKTNEEQKELEKLKFAIEQQKLELNNFISLFMVPTALPISDLSTIKFNLDKYTSLKNNLILQQKNYDALNQELILLKSNLDKFFAVYFADFSVDYQTMLNTMQFKINNLSNIKQEMQNCTTALQQFIQKTGINTTQKIAPADLQKGAQLNQQKTILQNELSTLNTSLGQTFAKIKNLSQEVDNISYYQNELSALKDAEQKLAYEVKILDNVKLYLEKANDSLTSKYISPMTKSFEHYSMLLAKNNLGQAYIDTNMEVSIEQDGAKRDKKFLSEGYKDITNLCMRFSLIDAIFPAEKPTIILDDPFINLDDENTKNALKLLEEISKDKQIIYLCCHSSRAK